MKQVHFWVRPAAVLAFLLVALTATTSNAAPGDFVITFTQTWPVTDGAVCGETDNYVNLFTPGPGAGDFRGVLIDQSTTMGTNDCTFGGCGGMRPVLNQVFVNGTHSAPGSIQAFKMELRDAGDFLCVDGPLDFVPGSEYLLDFSIDFSTGAFATANPAVVSLPTGEFCLTNPPGGSGLCWEVQVEPEESVQRIEFVPVCWTNFLQSDFDAAVDRMWTFFTTHSALAQCNGEGPGNEFELVRGDHICPTGASSSGPTPVEVLNALPAVGGGKGRNEIDVMVVVAQANADAVGGSAAKGSHLAIVETGGATEWTDGEYVAFAHEYGHATLFLGDEYFSAVMLNNPQIPPSINEPTAQLGCDPTTCCNNPFPDTPPPQLPNLNGTLCLGNAALNLRGWEWGDAPPAREPVGRCIMSNLSAPGTLPAVPADSQRGWCEACWNEWQDHGPKCGDVFAGFQHFFEAGLHLNPKPFPAVEVNLVLAGVQDGRAGKQGPTDGSYVLVVKKPNGAELGRVGTGPAGSLPSSYEEDFSHWLRLPIANSVTLPIQIDVLRSAQKVAQVTAGGSPPQAQLAQPSPVECDS